MGNIFTHTDKDVKRFIDKTCLGKSVFIHQPRPLYQLLESERFSNLNLDGVQWPEVVPKEELPLINAQNIRGFAIKSMMKYQAPFIAMNQSEFPHRYFTAGSYEAIRAYLLWKATSGIMRFYVLRGEYEGYREILATLTVEPHVVEDDEDPSTLPPGVLIISSPNARDGRPILSSYLKKWEVSGHTIALDAAYIGTDLKKIWAKSPAIEVVFFSLSKPYGAFSMRAGYCLSREIIPALVGNKWFTSSPAAALGILLPEAFGDLRKYHEGMKDLQAQAIQDVFDRSGLSLDPAGPWALATLSTKDPRFKEYAKSYPGMWAFVRDGADVGRFTLSRVMHQLTPKD